MERRWAEVLRKLRTENHPMLFGLASNLEDLEFTAEKILIHVHNETERVILTKYLAELNELAGGDVIQLVLPKPEEITADWDLVDKLREIFGDKLEVL